MLRLDAQPTVPSLAGLTRREFLRAGSLATVGLTLPGLRTLNAEGADTERGDVNCIFLFLVGGPSQLDTWDMKPDAPEEIRGPFRPIATNVPGTRISEIFPRLARQMDRVSLVRSVHHTAAAVHDTGHQLMQTGRLFSADIDHPHVGSVVAMLKGNRGETPAHVLLPRPIGTTGGNMPHGQSAGYLGKSFDPFVPNADPIALRRDSRDDRSADFEAYDWGASRSVREAFDLNAESVAIREQYGRTRFGESCLIARRLIERGSRFVTVNMFDTVFNNVTWDMHGMAPFSTLDGYRNEVGPSFDHAYTALLDDLSARGMLSNTLIVACGEFGRTPKINPAGGRDHHPACWTVLFAGGSMQGGRVVGASDEIGSAPVDRPVSPAEIAATVYQGLGIDLKTEIPGPDEHPIRIVDQGVRPISELF